MSEEIPFNDKAESQIVFFVHFAKSVLVLARKSSTMGYSQGYQAGGIAGYEEVDTAIETRMGKREQLNQFIKDLQERDGVLEKFDERLWGSMVECMTVYGKGDIRATFKDGTEV